MRFQCEEWSAALSELRPLFARLWDDVAVDKERFTAQCDEEGYAKLNEQKILHLVTARSDDGNLAGYFLCFIMPNPHYEGAGVMAFTDMYYVLPQHRKGNVGIRLFAFMEETLLERNVVKFYTSHKLHRDRSAMLKILGFKATDTVYTKVIG
jgi:GNAT superfamily N-acetyltransferase